MDQTKDAIKNLFYLLVLFDQLLMFNFNNKYEIMSECNIKKFCLFKEIKNFKKNSTTVDS